MPATSTRIAILHETIAIPRSPTLPSELTMKKYRCVFEDEKTGQEILGYSGLSRAGVDMLRALVDSIGEHALKAGNAPWKRATTDYRKGAKWATGVRRGPQAAARDVGAKRARR